MTAPAIRSVFCGDARCIPMKRALPSADPDAYASGLSGWQAEVVGRLMSLVLATGGFEERVKWGHLVYEVNGPALLIRAHDDGVQFGFWRGQRLRDIEPGLKPGGKCEMAKLIITGPPGPGAETVTALCREALRLNVELGNPQDAARR